MKLLPLGLDIAKLKFNACLRHEDGRLRHKVFANTTAGFAQLSDWLAEQGVGSAHACMEATGAYYEALAAYLNEAGHTVSLRLLSEQIKRTEVLIRSHIDNHPGLRRQRELLDSIPGIGETTAAALLAEVPDITQYRSAREVAAFAGLVPRERQNGSSVLGRVRLSKVGNARLRKRLYFPAVTERCGAVCSSSSGRGG